MNHMDENYWKNLAQSWIQSKQQTQQQIEIPAAPNINNSSDNHAEADMEIEDIKEDEPEKLWNWQNSNFQIQQPHQQLPVVHNFPPVHQPPSQSYHHFANKQMPLIIPEPPIIKTSYEDGASNNLVDMDMADSENEEDDSNSNSASSGMMDARKRKMLPIWIREGLEKMKREKEMEIQRQQEEVKVKEEEAKRKKLMEEALLELEREKAVKSKYDSTSSDDDNDDDDDDDSKRQKTDKIVVQNSVVTSEPIVEEVDDEEAYENMMLLVRKTLTSILLETTNFLIRQISNETLSKYRKKASATQSKTPALIGLGLGVYSSSSDDDSDNDEKSRSDQSDWEPESLLKERIRQKAITFEKRSKDVEDKLAKIAELEDIKYKRKKDSHESNTKSSRNNDHEEQKSKSNSNYEKDGGEEKYETKVSSSALSRMREKRTRFSDPKEGRSVTMTHVNVMQEPLRPDKGGIVPISLSSIYPPPPTIKGISPDKLEKSKKSKRRDSSTSSTSGSSSHRKKHKKHKKSSKHSKKSSKKRERSRSRSRSRDKTHHKSDRRSIESVRSTESRSRHSRSRSRDRRNRRRY